MSRLLSCIILSALFAATSTITAVAQSITDHDHEATHEGSPCGTLVLPVISAQDALAATARVNPEFYRELLAGSKHGVRGHQMLSSTGETFYEFSMQRYIAPYDLYKVTAVMVFEGRLSRIWIDTADVKRIKPATIVALARGLDSTTGATSRNPAKGIIENNIEVFGQPPTAFSSDGITNFLLTDILDGSSGGSYVAGFFRPSDQMSGAASNQMNLLYIDAKQGLGTQSTSAINGLLNTVAHEFQHLTHYNHNPESETFFNEGCSEVASILCGYKNRGNSGYLNNTNVPILRWSYDDQTQVLYDYERAMTFTHYLYEQYGEGILTGIAASQRTRMDRVADALMATGRQPDWEGALKGFAVANYVLKNYDDSRYTYQLRISNAIPKVAATYDTTYPASGQASLQQYASTYYVYKHPGPINVKFSASRALAPLALLYQDGKLIEVQELEKGVETALNQSGAYDKIVFVVQNLWGGLQTVNWTLSAGTLGINDALAGAAALAVTEVAPNPASGPVTVNFTTARTGTLQLELYNVQGEKLRTMVDGEHYEAGIHSVGFSVDGLNSGVYILRLVQGDRTVSRAMVVTK